MSQRSVLTQVRGTVARFCEGAALAAMAVVTVGYAGYSSRFAEIHFSIHWGQNSLPVFVGEWLLFVCIVLWGIRFLLERERVNCRVFSLLGLYGLFILVKALWGFHDWGLLAFRHAALFYYPFFSFLAYSVAQPRWLKPYFIIPLICAFCYLLYIEPYDYYVLPLCAWTLLLIFQLNHRVLRLVLFAGLLWVVPYANFFDSGRSRMLGNAAGLFTCFFLGMRSRLRGRYVRWLMAGGIAGFLAVWMGFFASRNVLRPLLNIPEVVDRWRHYDRIIADKQSSLILEARPVKLYNDNREEAENERMKIERIRKTTKTLPSASSASKKKGVATEIVLVERIYYGDEEKAAFIIDDIKGNDVFFRGVKVGQRVGKEIIIARNVYDKVKSGQIGDMLSRQGNLTGDDKKILLKSQRRVRSTLTAYNNILFRLFIWRDMVKQFKGRAYLWGMDWGYPFRSPSLETLGWAQKEWLRDGWVATHSSYFDILFRAGCIGVLLLCVLGVAVFRLLRRALELATWEAALFLSVIVFGLVVAAFNEFFELPYTAIPFWIFLGVAWAYFFRRDELPKKNL